VICVYIWHDVIAVPLIYQICNPYLLIIDYFFRINPVGLELLILGLHSFNKWCYRYVYFYTSVFHLTDLSLCLIGLTADYLESVTDA